MAHHHHHHHIHPEVVVVVGNRVPNPSGLAGHPAYWSSLLEPPLVVHLLLLAAVAPLRIEDSD